MSEEYEVRESIRAKHLRLSVYPDGKVRVTKPVKVSVRTADTFLKKHQAWIESTLEKFRKRAEKRKGIEQIVLSRPRKNSNAYKEARKTARSLVTERLTHFNALYGFTYGAISIRDQKTRWGSCSANGNLSFNYRIVYLPEALQDYVIVHELCHTKEHNHSERFWNEVTKAIPNHQALKKVLRARYR